MTTEPTEPGGAEQILEQGRAGVTLTGGGRFNPDEEFCYFIAGNGIEQVSVQHPYSLMACDTDLRASPEFALRMKPAKMRMLVDSGAFGLAQRHARTHDMALQDAFQVAPTDLDGYDDLLRIYTEVCLQHEANLWGYIEIDLGGTDTKRETRRLLEAGGLLPIPVYHPQSDGWDYFDELASGYDRIAIGNLVSMSMPQRKRTLATLWERRRRYPTLKWIHALGYTPNQWWNAYPVNSSDSSSWVYALRYGAPSAPGASAMGHSFSRFSIGYSYITGARGLSADSRESAVQMLGNNSHFLQEGLRSATRDLDATLGYDPVPTPMLGEPTPQPVEIQQ